MNSTTEEKLPVKPTPIWLKWILLSLLFAASAAGFIFSAPLFKKCTAAFPSPSVKVHQKPPLESSRLGVFSNLFRKSGLTRVEADGHKPLICQGTIIGKDGRVAVFNGQPVAEGFTTQGVRIIEITASNVLVEYNGRLRRLDPGESLSPR